MGHLTRWFIASFITFVLSVFLLLPQPTYAADVRAGDHISLSQNETNLKDLYLFGSNILVDVPVQNDLVMGGGDINLSGDVQNDLLLGGGNVSVKGRVGNTARVAGGNITIDGPVGNDLAIAGGNLTLTKNASIGGDLLIAGGRINIEGPVRGKVLVRGGDVRLNSSVGGDVTAGEVGTLTLGPQAKIARNLTYTSGKEIQIPSGAVGGKVTFHKSERQQNKQAAAEATGAAIFFKLIIDIIISLLLMYFFRQALAGLFERMRASPVQNGVYGFVFTILAPLAAIVLLILIWLGIASWLFIGLVFIISIYLVKLFLGWLVMRWWKGRDRHTYTLDWKAAVIGPILLTILLFIPVLGWIVAALLFFIAVGALISSLTGYVPRLQGTARKK